jgi:hypothetical protein
MEKGTTRIAGYQFENEDVIIDFTTYENCYFKNCKIIYFGQGPIGLLGGTFENCQWGFAGPAANTVLFLRAMYHGNNEGGRALVEDTFQNIRQPYQDDRK